MRRPIAIAFTTAILVCTLFVPAAFADQKGCTIANVKGTYGYVGFGTVLATNPFGLPAGTLSSMGTLTFDGRGNLLIVDTGRTDDIFFTPDLEEPSTYIVNDNCVATFTVTAYVGFGIPGPHFKAVFVDGRNGLRGMSLVPGLIINFVNTAKITAEDED
jgi:hypothetical protein